MVIDSEAGDNYKKSQLYQLVNAYQKHETKLTHVHLKYPDLVYAALRNHAKKHQALTETQLVRNRTKREITKVGVDGEIRRQHHTERRSNVVEWIQDKIDSGEVKPTLAGLVSLLKQEADIEAKQTDQAIEMQKLFNTYVGNPLPEQAVRRAGVAPVEKVIEGEVIEKPSIQRAAPGIIAVDFDGVIHDEKPPPGHKMGKPLKGALEALKGMTDRHEVIIFTVRAQSPAGAQSVADWMDYFGIPYGKITAIKPNADYYLDDKAVRFTSWDEQSWLS